LQEAIESQKGLESLVIQLRTEVEEKAKTEELHYSVKENLKPVYLS